MMLTHPGPIRPPLPRDLDWRDQSWRSRIGGRGMVGGLYPGYGFRDFVQGRPVTNDGVHDLPAVTPSAEMGLVWDFSGSKVASMGNWGNEYWAGPGKQFSITCIVNTINPSSGNGCILSKATDTHLAWEVFAISTTGGLNRIGFWVRSDSGGYLEMITNTPSFTVPTDRPVVITCTYNHNASGSDRLHVYINGQDVSSGYSAVGDFTDGIADNESSVIMGFWQPDNMFHWGGKVGGLWFHNRALTDMEIQILHSQTGRYAWMPVHEDDWEYGLAAVPTPSTRPYYFRNFVIGRHV